MSVSFIQQLDTNLGGGAVIKAVIFDAGGVLHDLPMDNVYDDVANTFGISRQELEEAWSGPLNQLGLGKITEVEFWELVLRNLRWPYDLPRTDLLVREFIAHYGLHHDVLTIVDQLKERGVKTVVLSNTIKPHADYAYQIGLYHRFDVRVLSHEVHFRKPDWRIWGIALRQLNIIPEEAIYFDDLLYYVSAAQDLGIHAFLYENARKVAGHLRAAGIEI